MTQPPQIPVIELAELVEALRVPPRREQGAWDTAQGHLAATRDVADAWADIIAALPASDPLIRPALQRRLAGLKSYGSALGSDLPLNWTQEALDEALDLMAYAWMARRLDVVRLGATAARALLSDDGQG